MTLDEILERGGDPDDVLRAAVDLLADRRDVSWAAICFREQDQLVPGPAAGREGRARRVRAPVVYRGEEVGELAVGGAVTVEELRELATKLAPYVLLGWDTGGDAWEP